MSQTDLFSPSPTWTYFNTNDLRGEQLKEARAKVTGQSLEILNVFAFNPQVEFTPWEINERTNRDYPITSIRRAISNLEKQGYLMKTGNTVEAGPYRSQNYTWKLNPKNLK
jgi:Fe2+ or Zn2+ uptake regulation protein